MSQLAIAKLGTQVNKGKKQIIKQGRCWKSWTSLRPERPGTRPKTTTRRDKKKDREEPNKTETKQTKQGNPIAQRQRDRRAKHQQTKRNTKGRTKGGKSVRHGLTARKGENHKGGVRGGREALPTNHTVPGKGEALTVLSQSTARKVRYLQVPGGRIDRY